ncbi:MAG: hypothetical protein JW976_14610 [Syntrophaceae bacterium]|nr:hypothetical protein [Syntrophaceae bacterium]
MKTEKKKIFSFPLNPFLTANELKNTIVPFLQRNKELIFDIYFTCKIPPFMQDAMGVVLKQENRFKTIFSDAMVIQQMTGIPVSATFNNVGVAPTDAHLDIFIENLKPLYRAGMRSMTIPHTLWLKRGTIQEAFPEMFIKNTVLRRVKTGQEFWYAAEAGFHLINIDRILMRDRKTLEEIKKAQEKFARQHGRYVYTAILANEHCLGRCPVMDEHHFFNNCLGSRAPGTNVPYFRQKVGKNCPRGNPKEPNPTFVFKMCNIPYFRENIEELLKLVDMIKMHGRNDPKLINESISFVDNYAQGKEEVLYGDNDLLKRVITNLQIPADKINQWRKIIRNCKFECWNCDFCDKLVEEAAPGLRTLEHVVQ